MNWIGINVKNTFNNYELTSPLSNGAVILKQYRSNISQSTGVFHLIFKHREVTYQTRDGVFHLTSKDREVTYQTRERVFHLISKHWEVTYQTREGVFHLISKHWEVTYKTRERVFHLISKHREVMHQTRGVRHQKSRHRERYILKTRSVSSHFKTPKMKHAREWSIWIVETDKWIDLKVSWYRMKHCFPCS